MSGPDLFYVSEKRPRIHEHLTREWLERAVTASDRTLVGAGSALRSVLVSLGK